MHDECGMICDMPALLLLLSVTIGILAAYVYASLTYDAYMYVSAAVMSCMPEVAILSPS